MMKSREDFIANRESIHRLEEVDGRISLTFDDGPHPENTPRILALLNAAGMKATFFCTASAAQEYPDIVRAALSSGHEIANHTIHHPNLDELATEQDIRDEICGAQTLLTGITGTPPTLFRAPCGRHDSRVWSILTECKLPSVLFSIGSRDWDRKAATAASIRDFATSGLRSGDIVLFHDWQTLTAEALPAIISDIQEKGLQVVTVSELLRSQNR